MKYICHRDYHGMTTSGEIMSIKKGEIFPEIARFIATEDGKAICYTTSEVANKYFARNDDKKGLQRGKLTYAIAYSDRHNDNGFRFSDEEIEMISNDYKHWIKDLDTIVFNSDFFHADVKELKKLAKKLNIK